MGGPNNTNLESFAVYSAKAFAGIGTLPDTIADRSIAIRLERRTRNEAIERFRRRDVAQPAEPIFQSLASLAAHHVVKTTMLDHLRLPSARPNFASRFIPPSLL
jgi:hypothetical protein